MFGKMKSKDAVEVLGDIAKADRRINRARQSIAPAPVCIYFSMFARNVFVVSLFRMLLVLRVILFVFCTRNTVFYILCA